MKQKTFLTRLAAALACWAAAIAVFLYVLQGFTSRNAQQQRKTLEDAIRRDTVLCYAIEGQYPPSVEYLEENYGLTIDRSRFAVFYSGFASNIMPDITVIELQGEGME